MEETIKFLALFIALCLRIPLVTSDLVSPPENDVAVVGSTVTLRCTASTTSNPRIIWSEFILNEFGFAISDGRTVIPSHPYATRYAITGTGNEFHLRISNVQLSDGGLYRCQDNNASPPDRRDGYAQLIVLANDTRCEEWYSIDGSVIEQVNYATQCQVDYSGAYAPIISWTGPGNYQVTNTTTPSQVWSQASFIADRSMQGGFFTSITNFNFIGPFPPDYATNTPEYSYTFLGRTINVFWFPTPSTVTITPIKSTYEVGDILTCVADSNPVPSYTWTNMRTLASTSGQTYVVGDDLLGTNQTMRCNAAVSIQGSFIAVDAFVNVPVPATTTVPPPTTPIVTTPPPADGECRDLSGHWISTNPSANLCIQTDLRGNLRVLIRNGTDLFFVGGTGKTVYGDYKHFGFSAIWPAGNTGTAGFSGECHNCFGNEVLLLSGLSRNKNLATSCGVSNGTQLTRLYVMTRSPVPCLADANVKVYNAPKYFIETLGLSKNSIITSVQDV